MQGIDKLFSDYGRIPVLPHEQQLQLARQVRAWLDWPGPDEVPAAIKRRGIRARQRLIETNLKLVVSVAKRWRRACRTDPGDFQDLVQIGTLGLARGVEKYDPTRGYALTTFCWWWIQQALSRHSDEVTGIVYLPPSASDRWRKLSRLVVGYERDNAGARPSISWLCEQTGLTHEQVQSTIVIGCVRVVASLDATAVNCPDGVSSLLDLIPAPAGEDPADLDLADARARLARDLVSQLEPRLQRMLPLTGGIPLREIAAAEGISRSRAGQLRQKAMEQLRNTAKDIQPDLVAA